MNDAPPPVVRVTGAVHGLGAEAMDARPVQESTPGVVWAAILPADDPTGGFFGDARPPAW